MVTRWRIIALAAVVMAASCHLVTGIDGAEFEPDGQGGAASGTSSGMGANTGSTGGMASTGGAPTTSSSMGGGGFSAGGGGYGTGGVDVCGHPPHPSPPTMCPAACTQCNGSTCVIECDGSGPMTDCEAQFPSGITCPPDWDCEVRCTGGNVCQSSIQCPAGHSCNVQCNVGGSNTCRNLIVQCADTGPCNLGCALGSARCRDAELRCGDSDCALNCTGSGPPPFKPTATCPSSGVGCACDDQC